MTVPVHPEPPSSGDDPVLAGLARQIDELRRRVDGLDPVPGRVDELGRLVSQMADTLATLAARRRPMPAPSWLVAPTGEAEVGALLDELTAWLATVFLRYPDAASVMPECWLWHPDVVEELLWLMHAWCAAYQGSDASVSAAGDWHDRQRPGVIARIRKAAGSCSIECHQTRPNWPAENRPPPVVPGLAHTALIVGWWATRRDQPAPEPAIPTGARPFGGALG
ncbi:hypothetical protein [Pseudonocardia sp. HH130629-09]|uniref:hypothetical protein n=1 Tax=Pseudonocardia sp. HH130629-09 TaxID=1641402 RepID=UPI0006CB3E08|nr:hypothetical protein [Pseudonocardia sp. HH130629-09]ALE82471.1 hypothetical protein XF36_04365 [Pseudonocardia sp. HH130629-09]